MKIVICDKCDGAGIIKPMLSPKAIICDKCEGSGRMAEFTKVSTSPYIPPDLNIFKENKNE